MQAEGKNSLTFFLRHAWRYHRHHPVLTPLNVAGIAVGVAVFASIRTVNSSSLAAFEAATQLITGPAQLTVRAPERIDEQIFPLIRKQLPEARLSPIVEELCLIPDRGGDYLQIAGIDLIATRDTVQLEIPREQQGDSSSILSFLTEPDAIALTERVASRLGLHVGDRIRLASPQGPWDARVHAIVKVEQVDLDRMEHLAFMDIASLQDRFGLNGKLNRIDIRLPDDADTESIRQAQEKLQAVLSPHLHIEPPDAQQARYEKMTRAFRLNLFAMSLIALLVGCFLVYNTVTASVVRRRREFGILRSLGLTRRGLQGLVILESLALAIPSALAGLGLGLALAYQLLQPVLGSITSHYVRVQASVFAVNPLDLVIAFSAGLLSVLVAAWRPAREAARLDPVQALSTGHELDGAPARLRRWTFYVVAAASGSLGAWLLLKALGLPWLSFVVATCVLLCFACLAPWTARQLTRLHPGRSVIGRIGTTHFMTGQHRNAITVAALVVALAMLTGVSIMVHSFRETVRDWIAGTMRADLYIAPASNFMYGFGESLPPAILDEVASRPEKEAYNFYRETQAEFQGDLIRVAATKLDVLLRYHPPDFMAGGPGHVKEGEASVWITDIFSRKHGVHVGDRIELSTPTGEHSFRVTAMYRDYTSEQGLIMLPLGLYQQLWNDMGVHSAALYLKKGVDRNVLKADLQKRFAQHGLFSVFSSAELRGRAMDIFDQTFAVTTVLKWLALGVAMLGVAISLLTLVAERGHEIGLLRSLGTTRGQVAGIILTEAAWIGATASLLGLAAGVALAATLSYVINMSFFGWTIEWHLPWASLVILPFITIGAALLAAWWPARKAGLLNPAEAMRES